MSNWNDLITRYPSLASMTDALDAACDLLETSFRSGGKLMLCGNGGSACDCAHIAGELCKGFLKRRPLPKELTDKIGEPWALQLQQGLPAIDLTAQTGVMTAVINDIDGASIFAQQVMAFGTEKDMLIGISTSGNAENVRRALITARAKGMKTLGMTGKTGGKMPALCDLTLHAGCDETYRIQEEHLRMYHQLCIEVEQAFFQE